MAVLINQLNFNSRLRKETNDDHATGAPDIYAFQLTSPQGNERPRKPLSLAPVYFNSRLLTETNEHRRRYKLMITDRKSTRRTPVTT